MENQLVGLAAYYSRNLSREVKKGLKENVLAGKITGGRPLFGYSVDKNKKYVINEEEAVAVRYIFERYAAGASYIDILKEVNARGYRTRRGAEFGKATLHDMLNNRRYIGTCILGKNQPYLDGRRNSHRPDHDGMIIVPNGCPAIISPDLFQAVHERMQETGGAAAGARRNIRTCSPASSTAANAVPACPARAPARARRRSANTTAAVRSPTTATRNVRTATSTRPPSKTLLSSALPQSSTMKVCSSGSPKRFRRSMTPLSATHGCRLPPCRGRRRGQQVP